MARDKEKENKEIGRVLRILAKESEVHAKKLESRYGIFIKAEAIDEGVTSLLSLMSERIANLKDKVLPVEVLWEGIKLEGYMEQLYKGLAENYENEEQMDEILLEVQKEETDLKPSELFKEIAADEKKHQEMLQRLAPRIVEGDSK